MDIHQSAQEKSLSNILIANTQSCILMLQVRALGVVLMQDRHPVSFESQKLRGLEKSYNIYDKEMLSIMHALVKFSQYLVGNKFTIKRDHNSLRHFLGQKDLNNRQ